MKDKASATTLRELIGGASSTAYGLLISRAKASAMAEANKASARRFDAACDELAKQGKPFDGSPSLPPPSTQPAQTQPAQTHPSAHSSPNA